MSGRRDGDPASLPAQLLGQVAETSEVRRVFSIGRMTSDAPLPGNIAPLFEAAVAQLSEAIGVPARHVTARELCGDTDIDDDWFTIATAEHVARFGREWVEAGLEQMHPGARGFMEWGLGVTLDQYLAARRRRFDAVRALDELLGDDGVLLSPVNGAAGWLADGRMTANDEQGMLPPEVFNTPLHEHQRPPDAFVAGRRHRHRSAVRTTGDRASLPRRNAARPCPPLGGRASLAEGCAGLPNLGG